MFTVILSKNLQIYICTFSRDTFLKLMLMKMFLADFVDYSGASLPGGWMD